jgi:hypothetical protein
MTYDLDLEVKYKGIEEELLEKLQQNIDTDVGYLEEDIYQICEELYKHELLSVFKVNNISNKTVQSTLSQLFLQIQHYPNFIKVIEKYKQKMSRFDVEETFILMFNYSLFAHIHKCIVCMYKNETTLLDEYLLILEKQIDKKYEK